MKVESYAISDQGRVRTRNEDSYLNDDAKQLYIVADGMGGHVGGDKASGLAVKCISEYVADSLKNSPCDHKSVSQAGIETEARLMGALKNANSCIFKESAENPDYRGMGTTATAIMAHDKQAIIAHVGDSRAYLIRDGAIRQITEDHSWVNEQVKAGFITNEEARTHRLKNVITRSLGHERDVRVDVLRLDLKPGDSYLLCSDGLSNMVTDAEIRELVSRLEPQLALETMVDLANERGGFDNITAVMLRIAE